jgi:hypothetical protein
MRLRRQREAQASRWYASRLAPAAELSLKTGTACSPEGALHNRRGLQPDAVRGPKEFLRGGQRKYDALAFAAPAAARLTSGE